MEENKVILGYQREVDDVQQILGKALGYPWYKDDQKNFPGSVEADGVCIGDNVASSLAEQAAAQIDLLKKKVELAENCAVAIALNASETLSRLTQEALNWQETAAYFSRGSDYYRSLVTRIGEAIGKDAFISDDGSVQDSVLCAKVPELVEAICRPKNRILRGLRIMFTGK